MCAAAILIVIVCVSVIENVSQSDFDEALELVRKEAAKYDPSHPSAPSLSGFVGANMAPAAFKDMFYRTFKIMLTMKQLSCLVQFYGLFLLSSLCCANVSRGIYLRHGQKQYSGFQRIPQSFP